MRGFISVKPPSDMVVNDLKLMIGPGGRYWIAMPSVRQVDKDGQPKRDTKGKPLYSPIIEFVDRESSEKFQRLILDALRREHPEVFDR